MASTWGENHDNKIAAFYKRVGEIDNRNVDVPKDHLSKVGLQNSYILTNYFFIEWYNNKYNLILCSEVYIPAKIRQELTEVFTEIFLSK